MRAIDLNADLGESYGAWRMGEDDALLGVVSSANVACGFHAGDPATILRTVQEATRRGVRIGAHVSYPDLVGFGRRDMDLAPEQICADVLYQLAALDGIARSCGSRVSYVKPHGALYNRAARDAAVAQGVAEAIRRYDPTLPLLLLAGAAVEGVQVVPEIFADRAYTADGRLVPRSEPGALLHEPQTVVERIVNWLRSGTLTAIDGTPVPITAASVCVHGDSPGAVAMARGLREGLAAAGIDVRAFR